MLRLNLHKKSSQSLAPGVVPAAAEEVSIVDWRIGRRRLLEDKKSGLFFWLVLARRYVAHNTTATHCAVIYSTSAQTDTCLISPLRRYIVAFASASHADFVANTHSLLVLSAVPSRRPR